MSHLKDEEARQRESKAAKDKTKHELKENNGINPAQIGLIWLDVQGHEAYALTGAGEILNDIPVVTEIWPYALERSGLGVDSFIQLATKYFNEFWILSSSSVPTPIKQLSTLIDKIGRSPRNAIQIVLLPCRRNGHPKT